MYIFQLNIHLPGDVQVDDVSTVLGLHAIDPISEDGSLWMVEDEQPESGWIDFIGRYCESIRSGLSELQNLGIGANDISICMLYEYDQQCDMEFNPDELKAMGELGITFCISCWEK